MSEADRGARIGGSLGGIPGAFFGGIAGRIFGGGRDLPPRFPAGSAGEAAGQQLIANLFGVRRPPAADQPRAPEVVGDRPLPPPGTRPAAPGPTAADRPAAPSSSSSWPQFVVYGPRARFVNRRRSRKRRRKATPEEERQILRTYGVGDQILWPEGRGGDSDYEAVFDGLPDIRDPVYGTWALEEAQRRATAMEPLLQFAPGGPGLPQPTRVPNPTSWWAILGRWVLGRTILGVLWPSQIDPEAEIPRRSPGPPRRGGARRPPTGASPSPADLPAGRIPTVAWPQPTTRPAPNRRAAGSSPSASRSTGTARPAPAPAPAANRLPGTRAPAPARAPGTSAPGSVAPSWRDLLPYVVPVLLDRARTVRPRMGRVQLANPMDPTISPDSINPLTAFQPGRVGSSSCVCTAEKPRKRRKKTRTECRTGTYTETATGLRKRPKRKVPCR